MVQNALEGWALDQLDFVIENVGNLVCPSSYDLGEELRLVLLSVTEGEDKPLKYPTIFNTADVAIITKLDLATAVEFDRAGAHRNIQVRSDQECRFLRFRPNRVKVWRNGWAFSNRVEACRPTALDEKARQEIRLLTACFV